MTASVALTRTAALLMLLLVVLGSLSMFYVPSVVTVPGDAEAAARRVLAFEGLFRAGLTVDALIVLIEVAVTALLYVLFTPINAPLSVMAAFARLGMAIVQGVNLLNRLALFFMDAHAQVVLTWGLLFALHLAVLVVQSRAIPRWVGALLGVAAACSFVQDLGRFLLPQFRAVFTSVASCRR